MDRTVTTTAALVFALAAAASIQGQAQAPTVAPQAPAEKYTEVEQLQRENLNLQAQLARALAEKADCYAALGPAQAATNSAAIQKQLEAFKAKVEANHPGYVIDERGELVKKPTAPAK